MIFILCLPVIISGLSTSACPSYTCSTVNGTTVDSVCISVTGNLYSVAGCTSSGLFCEPGSIGQNGTCQNSVVYNYSAYPGESCANNSNCSSSNCLKGVCKGTLVNLACASSYDCDVGLSCQSGKCASQIAVNGYGCYNDYDCVNNAGCSFINTLGQGTCIGYFSLSAYSSVNYCYSNKNNLCLSGSCTILSNGTQVCLPELGNSLSTPYSCSTADFCYSITDTTTNTVLQSKCECGLSGNSYCTLFPGDPEAYDYKNMRSAWLKTQEIHSCHTLRRFSSLCMNEKWDSKKYSYWYYEGYVNLYPFIYGAKNCLIEVYYPQYYEDITVYQLSGSMIIGVFFLFNWI